MSDIDENALLMRAALKVGRKMRHLQKLADMNSPNQSEIEMKLAEREFDWALEAALDEINDK